MKVHDEDEEKYLFDIHQTAEEVDRLSQQASGSFVFSKQHRFLFSKSQITCGIYRTTTYIITPVAHFSRPLPTLWAMSSEHCQTWTIGEFFAHGWKLFSSAGLSPQWWQQIGSMAGFYTRFSGQLLSLTSSLGGQKHPQVYLSLF